MAVKRLVCTVIPVSSFAFVVYTVARLAVFLSYGTIARASSSYTSQGTMTSIMWDTGLALQFCFLHSVFCLPSIYRLVEHYFGVFSRSFYLVTCCASLMLLMSLWLPVDKHLLWNMNTAESSILWWTFTAIHCVCWAFIYISCVITDLGELAGIKQVWCNTKGHRYTTSKSSQLTHFMERMRHPSFLALSFILWVYPQMTLDRVTLALIFTLYPAGWFKTQELDYVYSSWFFKSKKRGLFSAS
ncbi:nurim homolog [Amblyomma americanum]